jgi:crescentin
LTDPGDVLDLPLQAVTATPAAHARAELARLPKAEVAAPFKLDGSGGWDGTAAAPARADHLAPPSMDAVGQQNELIRVRISNLADRLEEVRTLKDDFAVLVEPVLDFIDAYPQLQARSLELEALLRHERDASTVLRRDVADLKAAYTKASDELSVTLSRLRKHDEQMRDQEGTIEDLRLAARDKEALVADLNHRLQAEAERARAIAEEGQALRQQAQEADQVASRSERELLEMREKHSLIEHEVRRLQKVTEDQAYRLTGLSNRYSEVEGQLEASRRRASELEAKLTAEQAERIKLEGQAETSRSAHQAEFSAVEMRMEGLVSRLAATDKILSNTRDQLREKNEALRAAERALKDALIERNTLERRIEALQQEIERQSAQITELQKARVEALERAELMTKAIGTKDFQIESADAKAASLSQRIEQLTQRFEQDKAALEATNRRLTEDLQNERAERALIQGALEIARESRVKIQQQYASLRQKSRFGGDEVEPRSGEASSEASQEVVIVSKIEPLKKEA